LSAAERTIRIRVIGLLLVDVGLSDGVVWMRRRRLGCP
jgi:hypothetical protein